MAATSTLRFARLEELFCLVHGKGDPSMDDWRQYVERLAEAITDHNVRKLLVVSDGGGPNAAQRKVVVDRITPPLGGNVRLLKTAVCTSSPLARGITVALGWLSAANITGFGYEERHQALDFLGAPVSQQGEALETVTAALDALAGTRR